MIQDHLTRLFASRRAAWVLVALLLAALLFQWQYAFRHVYIVPVWELALFGESMMRHQQAVMPGSLFELGWRFALNGHWLFVPFWIFYIDFVFDEATGRLPMWLSWLSLLAIAWRVGRRSVLVDEAPRRPRDVAIASLVVAVVLFWPAAMESMISPLQLLTGLSLLAGALALDRVVDGRHIAAVPLAWLLAFLSMASFGYGVALWAVLAFALLLDRRWWGAAATLVVAAAMIALFSRIIGPGYSQSVGMAMSSPLAIIDYALSQAGSVGAYLVHQMNPWIARATGAMLLMLHLLLTVVPWRRARNDRSARWLWLFAGWMLLLMLQTGLGRHYLGPMQAISSRYLEPAALYAVCLVALLWRLLPATGWPRRALAMFVAMLLLVQVVGAPVYADRFAAIRVNQRAAVLAEALGVNELHDGIPNSQLNAWRLPEFFGWLRDRRMGYYGGDWVDLINADFDARFGQAPRRNCRFGHDLRNAASGGDLLAGWIFAADDAKAPRDTLFIADGRIVGLAISTPRTDLVPVFSTKAAIDGGFFGFAPGTPAPGVEVWGLFDDGSVCAAGHMAARPGA